MSISAPGSKPPHHLSNTHASYTPPRDNPAAHTPETDTLAAGTPAEAAAEAEDNVRTGSLSEELGGGKTAGAAHNAPAYNLETGSLTEGVVHGTLACSPVVEVGEDTAATDDGPSTVARGGIEVARRGFEGEDDHGVEESCGNRCFGGKGVDDHLLHPCIESQSSGRLR